MYLTQLLSCIVKCTAHFISMEGVRVLKVIRETKDLQQITDKLNHIYVAKKSTDLLSVKLRLLTTAPN